MIVLKYVLSGADPNRELLQVQRVLDGVRPSDCTIKVVARGALKGPWSDVRSEFCIVAVSKQQLSPVLIKAMRWATHKRYASDKEAVKRQVVCDVRGGDESRVRRPRDRSKRNKGF